jgi:type VI secretion system protein ImpL
MQRFWQFLTDTRTLTVIGFVALASFLFLGLRAVEVAAVWAGAIFIAALLIGLIVWFIRKRRATKASAQLGDLLEQQAVATTVSANKNMRAEEVELLRKRMLEAVQKIKTSKLGETSGTAALYELPWYMIIGNPAAGKSTAIANSGMQFPLADKTGKVIHGVGGTRNCDWFFTSDGIVLDTAGRYSVHDEDTDEWFGFLNLLKKHRAKAPINGIIIAASIGELIGSKPEFAISLAKSLRQRVQELTERLEVFAPVYLVFTKADLISGFTDFFQETEQSERDRVWGATLPYAPTGTGEDAAKLFDKHFDELYDGLREMSLANMALNQDETKATGLLTFPLEFASIKAPLKAFILTLFEDNPFQFKPVFRGFYFTSALQDGASASTSSERVAERFSLKLKPTEASTLTSQHGFFLHDLFRKVIFADKALVSRFASRAKTRLRYTAFIAATATLAVALTAWSWSYVNNRKLIDNVQADLDKVVRLQDKRVDLQSRMEALEILQDRIEQLDQYRQDRPLSLGLGLYKGELLDQKLRAEYFNGIKEVLLKPVAGNLESFLSEVVASGDKLEPMGKPPQSAAASAPAISVTNSSNRDAKAYKDSSPANAEDAYNALKTYLMLSDKSRVESGHLNDQLARFWRGWLESNRAAMPREQMIRSAERLISFFLSQVNDPAWPLIENKLTLVDQSRDSLRRVVRGMPARERVYSDVKARASTRFAPMTVARIVGDQDKELIAGSYAIAGTFTREAWEKYIEDAFKEAANKELQSEDWVLKTASRDDLTLEGSPEQIQKALVAQYKTEYAKEWSKFVEGVTATELTSFDQAVVSMNKFGDPQNSPISKLINTVYQQTSWDNPSLINEGVKRAQRGIIDWFKETILRQSPSGVNVNLNLGGTAGQIPMGPVGTEFAGVARMVVSKDKDTSLMRGYLESLSKLRSRFNQIKNQGDTGPGAKQLMQHTLEGSGSELAEALKFVDEQMLVGMTDAQRKAIRPILVRPLVQGFSVIIKPTESELNKTWLAQVYDPFLKTLGSKYPFALDSKIEATSSEIGLFFGAEGAISKYVTTVMGPLVVRRGDSLSPKTWGEMGIALAPEVVAGFPSWIAPLSSGGAAASGAGGGADAQTVFQIQPLPASGITEYTVEIDGQQLRYRNTQAQWANFVWPNPQGAPGARVVATTFDGRTLEMANHPGRFGLEKLINSAQRKRKDNGVFELTWANGGVTVSIDLKIISSPQASAGGAAGAGAAQSQSQGYRGLRLPAAVTRAPIGSAVANPLPVAQAPSSTASAPGAAK